MTNRFRMSLLILMSALLLLAACGGAGSTGTNTGAAGTNAGSDAATGETRVKENAALGAGPIVPVAAEDGPAGRGATGPTSDVAGVCLSAAEGELARLVNEYRASLGLPPMQISKSLTLVAQQHAWDSVNNSNALPAPPAGKTCNLHSWSGNVNPALQQGTWTANCYTSDHANAEGMWNKPREIAGYPADGVENSFWSSGTASHVGALTAWKNSPGHNNVITQQGGWGPMAAMGVGMSGGIAHLWMSATADPAGAAVLCSGGDPMTPPTAVPPTAVPPTAVPPTTAPAAPTGTVLNENGEVAAGASRTHTFNVSPGRTYTTVITPAADFDADPAYDCSGQGSGASGTFDLGWEGEVETFTFSPTFEGQCTVTVRGYNGAGGSYAIKVDAR